jgi:cardiolipin synthase
MKKTVSSKVSLILGVALFWSGVTTYNASASGNEFYENASGSPLINVIKATTSTLDIEIYTMNDPNVGAEIKNAQNRGVKVRIIQEGSPVGAACHIFSAASSTDKPECAAEKTLVSDIISRGGKYIPFSKSLCGSPGSRCYQHGKLLIADSRIALVSTGNFDSTSLCDLSNNPSNCDRDYTLLIRDGQVVKDLQTVFQNDLNNQATDFTRLNPSLTVSPNSMKPLVDFINSARSTLQIENQYLEDPTMNAAIIAAAGRGVRVTVVVSSTCAFGRPKPPAVTKWTNIFTSFDNARIKVQMFVGRIHVGGIKGYLHAKAMIADGKRAWVGSVNGSTTAITDNREFGLFFNDSSMVSALEQYVTSDTDSSLGETWQDSL